MDATARLPGECARPLLLRDDAVLSGLLGLIERAVGAHEHVVLGFSGAPLRNACAERDQHALVVVQEELAGQLALYPGHDLRRGGYGRLGEKNDEFLAAITRDDV